MCVGASADRLPDDRASRVLVTLELAPLATEIIVLDRPWIPWTCAKTLSGETMGSILPIPTSPS